MFVQRLDQEIGGAGLERVVADLAVVDHGDDDDGHVHAMGQGADLFDELDAIEFGQLVVGEHDVDAIVACEFKGARRRIEEFKVQFAVDLPDDFGQQQAAGEKIVDDQDGVALRAGERQLRYDAGAGLDGASWSGHEVPPAKSVHMAGKIKQKQCHLHDVDVQTRVR